MSTLRLTGLLAVCAAFAACADSPSSRTLAPNSRANTDVAAEELVPVIGAFSDLEAYPADVSAEAAATGGRESGHYGIALFGGTLAEQLSSIALSTDPTPTAKGEVEWHAVNGATTFEVHADVACLSIVGSQAWVSGPIERFLINGEPVTGALPNVQFRVIDLGEGHGTIEGGSQLFYASTPTTCALRFPLPMYVSDEGNIQVRQR